ncbi:hypothetical protein [Actinomadura logoneensis]|uniref:hypothetical protein n=1 Tax=Actinomadura logoneensis TaxID=2293572 RepID=UPI001314BFAE|nr:hypothetical protein [Actinomadura logoneensis]
MRGPILTTPESPRQILDVLQKQWESLCTSAPLFCTSAPLCGHRSAVPLLDELFAL